MAVHISPVRIQRIKERWEREVLAGLERQERRLDRARDALARVSVPDQRERDQQSLLPAQPRRAALRRDGQLELFAATRRPVRLVQGNGWVRRWLRFGRHGVRWRQAPEKGAHVERPPNLLAPKRALDPQRALAASMLPALGPVAAVREMPPEQGQHPKISNVIHT
jgi:hypothetical protein